MSLPARVVLAAMFTAISSTTTATAAGTVYVVHGIPGVTVDVWVNGERTIPDFEPGTITDGIELEAGDYDLALTLPGGELADAILGGSATVSDGSNTSIVAHLDADGSPTISLFSNELGELGPARGRLVIRHVAAAPAVDIYVNWRWARLLRYRDVMNGDEASRGLFATTYGVTLKAAGTRTTFFGPADVEIERDEATIVYAIGSLDEGTFGVLVQNIAVPEPVPSTAQVSVVHAVPGLTVDVYLNGELALEDFEPETITDRLELPAGDYDIAITAADAPIEDAVITASATVPGGADISVVAHLAADGTPTITPFVNDLSAARILEGRVVVRHVAAAPTVDIVVTRGRWFSAELSDIENGSEAAADLLVGRYAATIFPAEGDDAVAGPVDVLALPFRTTIVYAFGSLEDGTFGLLEQQLPLESKRLPRLHRFLGGRY